MLALVVPLFLFNCLGWLGRLLGVVDEQGLVEAIVKIVVHYIADDFHFLHRCPLFLCG
jgi:hypothetical protein